MSPEVLKQTQEELSRRLLHLVLADQDGSLVVEAAEKNTVRIARPSGEALRMEFDEHTGLPVKESYSAGRDGVEMIQTFSDWRDVDGIKMPFRITFEQGGQNFADAVVDEYKFNSGVKPEDVSRIP
jgi:hypothetical protein